MQSKKWAIWSAYVGIIGGAFFNGVSLGITRCRYWSKRIGDGFHSNSNVVYVCGDFLCGFEE